jgi:glycosyltransferase involved in cell wall biosynthesis
VIEKNGYREKLVTVYLITHNRAFFLQRAIKSVLSQSYDNFELIVVDDASTDETETIMNELASNNKRLTYIRLSKNMGANYARNVAINRAKGYYVTGLDDDDEMLPDRIKKMVNAYDERYAFVVSEHYLDYGNYRKYKSLTSKKYLSFDDLLFANLVGNQILTTKTKIINSGLFDDKVKAAQDHDMWIRLLQNGEKAKIIKEALQIIYIGHDSITMSKNKFSGYFQVYNKYKKYFSKEQRKYWLLNFYYWRDKKINYQIALKLLPMHFKYFFISIAKIIKVNTR